MTPDAPACPLLAALVDDHAAFRQQREAHPDQAEAGRRAAEETARDLDRRVEHASAMSHAIAKLRRDTGMPPTDILTPRMLRDSLFASEPAPLTGTPVGLAPGLAEALQPKTPDA